jgi:RHS repeat-associated protein
VLDFDDDEDVTEFTRHFYHRNALGSVMEITEMDEDVAVSYRYDPYGAVTITRNSQEQSSDPLGNPWMYTARFTDEETGLYYYRARAYSPATGRFLQRDPLGYAPGPNLYAYASSSPGSRRDPLGTWDVNGDPQTPAEAKEFFEFWKKEYEMARDDARRMLGDKSAPPTMFPVTVAGSADVEELIARLQEAFLMYRRARDFLQDHRNRLNLGAEDDPTFPDPTEFEELDRRLRELRDKWKQKEKKVLEDWEQLQEDLMELMRKLNGGDGLGRCGYQEMLEWWARVDAK